MTEPDVANAANQIINTTQPTPLRGLVLRGVKEIPTINTVKKEGNPDGSDRYMIVNEADYDKKLHGEKVDKIPSRKKKPKKKAKNKEEESTE